jgi:hypothetical protein
LEETDGKILTGRPRCTWEYNIEKYIKEKAVKTWTGFIWLRIGAGGGLL